MAKLKSKLLVIGDSFMCQDLRFPGSHWSEFSNDIDIVNVARIGASNTMIFRQLLQHIESAEFVVAGFTNSQRLEIGTKTYNWKNPIPSEWDYITTAQECHFTDQQQSLRKHYIDLVDQKIAVQISMCQIVGTVMTALNRGKKIAFSYGLFEEELERFDFTWVKPWTELLEPYHLGQNLSHYPDCKITGDQYPLHHVDSMEWQQNFYQAVLDNFNLSA